ncbi:thiopeptide-type bacteriocin biosynthesis protein [Chryseobacterium sp. ISL-6]|uniref:thiopeptide-type bacteriocin biosynthesis protein n=1 Tax=Chryseobacterium sp. ISL-6 TaxID=2819143 RepID=UPI001BEBD174|nr:thiopeptide-type bacteriocin biosynthesis protein [Chryseobacterium sp. ISL-6]MBT2620620.1 thiopeptide-type bacteriocin biosynthesis protein [Chryseobacterium sp. ISL-6]
MMKNRKYAPGSEWLYFKIYTGFKTADKLLLNKIYPLITDLKRREYIKQFFFIRYSDPHYHLRVRLHIADQKFLGEIMVLFNKTFSNLLNNNIIWKIQIDTYNQEIERYNIHLIDHIENFFHIDSEYIIKILKTVHTKYNNDEDVKWVICLKLIDSTLDLFCSEEENKLTIISAMSDSFKDEFGFNMYNSKQFNEKYRTNKAKIEAIVSGVDIIEEYSYESLYNICKKRYRDLTLTTSSIKEIQLKKQLSQDIVIDLIHMMINRLIPAENRLHELILYDFVKRYYSSIIARKNNKKQIKKA